MQFIRIFRVLVYTIVDFSIEGEPIFARCESADINRPSACGGSAYERNSSCTRNRFCAIEVIYGDSPCAGVTRIGSCRRERDRLRAKRIGSRILCSHSRDWNHRTAHNEQQCGATYPSRVVARLQSRHRETPWNGPSLVSEPHGILHAA